MSEEPLELHQEVKLPYYWAAGSTATRFFKELRDKKRIMGTRCPKCMRVLVPARTFCPRCFVDTKEWVPVGSEGKVRTFTIVYYGYPQEPREPPYAIAIIDLEGADTGFVHYLGGVDVKDPESAIKQIKVGMRVRAVFRKKREGKITDIEHFEPVR